jgi:ABC-type dipeptide/oligopeptide/nickel transport system ATPase subunit
MTRTFTATPARRESVPLLVGLMGPSGSGKTYSALRLAKGIQSISGGDIYVIDTESSRAKHYAEEFTFKHVPFSPPFGSVDYLECIRWCVKDGARVIVVDSMSHEHAGEGGYLDFHGKEIERMAGNDYAKQERVKMAGWIKPSAARQKLINGLLQLNANFIFCFRAKEKTKPVKGGGIQELGWMPIAGEEFTFEQTLNCLLPPASKGVPQWTSEQVGERTMMKLPRQFEDLFRDGRALDEKHGVALAEWARGAKSNGGRPPADQPAAVKIEPAPEPAPAPASRKTAAEWCGEARGEVVACKNLKELNTWLNSNASKIDKLTRYEKGLAAELQDLISQHADSFNLLAAG